MPAVTEVPVSLEHLGEVIRKIERESEQPSQLVVHVGKSKYVVGDLRKRSGEYLLEIDDILEIDEEYKSFTSNNRKVKRIKNPHHQLEGSYKSFEALQQAIERTQQQKGMQGFFRNREAVYLIGSLHNGWVPAVLGMNFGSAEGQGYLVIGKIIFPLLQEGEQVSLDKIKI